MLQSNMQKNLSKIYSCNCTSSPILILLLLIFTTPTWASENAAISQTATWKEITDSFSNAYSFNTPSAEQNNFTVSRDATRAAYLVTQGVMDARGCFAQQLITSQTDGTNERLIEQGFTYNDGSGNNCAGNLFPLIDISDDGSQIVYLRLNNDTDLAPQIILYDTNSQLKTILLEQLPHETNGGATIRNIEPVITTGQLKISGDGARVFFTNQFGPFEAGFNTPSGTTIYQVTTVAPTASALFSETDIAAVSTIAPNAAKMMTSNPLATSTDGTKLLATIADATAIAPENLLLLDTTQTGSDAASVLLTLTDQIISGATIDGSGNRIAFSRTDTTNTENSGVFVKAALTNGEELLIDAGAQPATTPDTPQISKDGKSISYNYQPAGSQPTIRWAEIRTNNRLPVSLPASRALTKHTIISENGTSIFYLGAIMPDGNFDTSIAPPTNIIRFDWNPTGGSPAVAAITGSPSILLTKPASTTQPAPIIPTWSYSATGDNLSGMYSWPYIDAQNINDITVQGFHPQGLILDDGIFDGDLFPTDGIFTDTNIGTTPTLQSNSFTVRAAVATQNRTAACADFLVTVLPTPALSLTQTIPADNPGSIQFTSAGVTLEFTNNTMEDNLHLQQFTSPPPGLQDSLGEFWRIAGLRSPFSATITFKYDDAKLNAAGIDPLTMLLLKSTDSGKTWQTIQSTIDTDNKTIATAQPQTSLSLWTIAPAPSTTATYEITLQTTWSNATHPDPGFPSNPHFSPPIGTTHNGAIAFWQNGTLASDGIEQMAETGGTTQLAAEIQTQIGFAANEQILQSGFNSPGSIQFQFETTNQYPLLTLVTMIAPSPDWFIGVDSLDLRSNGQWLNQIIIPLQPYDSGTDSGTQYTSPNDDTQPPQPISEITSAPFLPPNKLFAPSLGTLTIRRLSIPILQITPLTKNFDANSSSTTFNVSNVGDGSFIWNTQITQGSDWLTITSGATGTNEGTIEISVDQNSGAQNRTAFIEVTADNAAVNSPITLRIDQSADLTLEKIRDSILGFNNTAADANDDNQSDIIDIMQYLQSN